MQVSDGGLSDEQLLRVLITDMSEGAPVTAADDVYATRQGDGFSIGAAGGLLANDVAPDGGKTLVGFLDAEGRVLPDLRSGSGPGGTISADADGSFTYSTATGPSDPFVGALTATYRMRDVDGSTDDATVTIRVGLGTDSDVLSAGPGDDELIGLTGPDAFFFPPANAGNDTFREFGAEDVLVTTNALRDNDRDGIISFGSNRRLDFATDISAVISDPNGRMVRALEFDGSFEEQGVTYFVYSRVGSPAGVETAQAFNFGGLDL